VTETCTGAVATCPPDAVLPSSVVCRVAAGVCDLAENCTGTSGACPADAKRTTVCRAAASACDAAETCDGVADTCPTDGLAAAGTVCRPPAIPCDTAEVCNGTSGTCPADTGVVDGDGDSICDPLDDCPQDPDPAQLDGDADDIGDACDPCTNTQPVLGVKTKLTMSKLGDPDGDDRVKFKGTITVPAAPPIDPAANGIRLVVADDDATVVDVTVPGGALWKPATVRPTWIYRDKLGSAGGITKIVIKERIAGSGELKFTLTGKLGTYGTPTPPTVKATLVIDSPTAETGQCGETTYTDNTESACRFLGVRVICK